MQPGPTVCRRDNWRNPLNAGMRYPSPRPGSVKAACNPSAPPEIYRASAGHVPTLATPGPTDGRENRFETGQGNSTTKTPPSSLHGRKEVARPFPCVLARLPHPSILQGHRGARWKMPGQGRRVKMSTRPCAHQGCTVHGSFARRIPRRDSELLDVPVTLGPAGARHNPLEDFLAQRGDHEDGCVPVGVGPVLQVALHVVDEGGVRVLPVVEILELALGAGPRCSSLGLRRAPSLFVGPPWGGVSLARGPGAPLAARGGAPVDGGLPGRPAARYQAGRGGAGLGAPPGAWLPCTQAATRGSIGCFPARARAAYFAPRSPGLERVHRCD